MAERRIVKLERLTISDGAGGVKTASFFIRPGTCSRPWIWFEPEEVPAFDDPVGWFELERVRGGWKVLHQIPKTLLGTVATALLVLAPESA